MTLQAPNRIDHLPTYGQRLDRMINTTRSSCTFSMLQSAPTQFSPANQCQHASDSLVFKSSVARCPTVDSCHHSLS